MARLFIMTSNRIKNIIGSETRRISNLSEKDIHSILNNKSLGFPIMISSNDERDNHFINKYQQVVVFTEKKNPEFNGKDRLLVVSSNEKTLYFI